VLKTGPASLFDMEEILDETTLDIQVISDEIVNSIARPGKAVRIIELNFTSQENWHGFKWEHYAKVYIPSGYLGSGEMGIIGQKWQDFEPGSARSIIPETGQNTLAEYAEGTALDLDIPIMAFAVPGENINGMDESDFTGWALAQMLQTGDYTWYSYYPITMAYLRAITLASNVLKLKKPRAVLLGCSKRGAAVSIATGVDPERVAGVMTTCFHGGNHLYMAALKFAQFGKSIGGPADDRTGPGFVPAPQLLRSLNNPIGLTALAYYDPYLWREKIKSAYFVVLGTNDEFFGIGSPNEMMNSLNGDKAFLAIDNTEHTYVSQKHLLAWRMWLQHSLKERLVPDVTVEVEMTENTLVVDAYVTSQLPVKAVKLFYAYNESTDWRFATWESISLKAENGIFKGRLERFENLTLGYYIQVKDEKDGLISSLIEMV
jgi:PhoPQ-activated pathogenicity-related protein